MFNNYRPVSLPCVISEVFESIMYSRLIEHHENCRVLMNKHFLFVKHTTLILYGSYGANE